MGPASQELIEGERQDYAYDDSASHACHGRGEYNPQDMRALRAQSDANTEFVGALRNGIRDDAVESYRG